MAFEGRETRATSLIHCTALLSIRQAKNKLLTHQSLWLLLVHFLAQVPNVNFIVRMQGRHTEEKIGVIFQ